MDRSYSYSYTNGLGKYQSKGNLGGRAISVAKEVV